MSLQLTPVGRTNKTHGFDGTLRITIEPAYENDYRAATVIFLEVSGQPTPFFVEDRRGNDSGFIKLEEVDSREDARSLTDKVVFLRREDIHTAVARKLPQTDLLIGFLIRDQEKGTIGKIIDTMELPQQLMAVVMYQDQEVLIPLSDALILSVDSGQRHILMDLPEGLLDI